MPKGKGRIVTIGLRINELNVDRLEEIASKVQDRIEELLEELMPISKSFDADIIVSLENKGDRVDVYIDIGIMGRLDDVIDYDSIAQVIIREASNLVEKELRKHVFKDNKNSK